MNVMNSTGQQDSVGLSRRGSIEDGEHFRQQGGVP